MCVGVCFTPGILVVDVVFTSDVGCKCACNFGLRVYSLNLNTCVCLVGFFFVCVIYVSLRHNVVFLQLMQ